MTNKDLFNLYEALEEITQNREIRFNIQLSYSLAYNKRLLEPCYQIISEMRRNLFEKYGESTDTGWTVPFEKVDDFQKEWKAFMDADNPLELRKIKLETFPDTQISVDLINRLFPIIIE